MRVIAVCWLYFAGALSLAYSGLVVLLLEHGIPTLRPQMWGGIYLHDAESPGIMQGAAWLASSK